MRVFSKLFEVKHLIKRSKTIIHKKAEYLHISLLSRADKMHLEHYGENGHTYIFHSNIWFNFCLIHTGTGKYVVFLCPLEYQHEIVTFYLEKHYLIGRVTYL